MYNDIIIICFLISYIFKNSELWLILKSRCYTPLSNVMGKHSENKIDRPLWLGHSINVPPNVTNQRIETLAFEFRLDFQTCYGLTHFSI